MTHGQLGLGQGLGQQLRCRLAWQERCCACRMLGVRRTGEKGVYDCASPFSSPFFLSLSVSLCPPPLTHSSPHLLGSTFYHLIFSRPGLHLSLLASTAAAAAAAGADTADAGSDAAEQAEKRRKFMELRRKHYNMKEALKK